MAKIKVTNEDFDFFVKCCKKYLHLWKLDDWDVSYRMINLSDRFAQTLISLSSRSVTLDLCNEWEDSVDPKNKRTLESSAKHEVVHVLLAPIANLADQRYLSWNDLVAGEHAVVQKLMKLL